MIHHDLKNYTPGDPPPVEKKQEEPAVVKPLPHAPLKDDSFLMNVLFTHLKSLPRLEAELEKMPAVLQSFGDDQITPEYYARFEADVSTNAASLNNVLNPK